MGGQGAKARSIAYCDDGTTPTLKSVLSGGNTVPDVVYCFEPKSMKDENWVGNEIKNALRANASAVSHAVCYAIEGNSVDRATRKNGRGWCEGVSPTLNTQDRHAVIYALEGNGARPSHHGGGTAQKEHAIP